MFLIVWLSVVYLLTSHYEPAGAENNYEILEPEERRITPNVPKVGTNKFLETEALDKGIPKLVGRAGFASARVDQAIGTKPAEEEAWEIADIVLPVVLVGLGLIPVVGPVISGIVGVTYGVLSIFLRKRPENPMDKVITDIHTKLEDINERISKETKETKETLRRERNEQLGKILNQAFHSEINRNQYICNKYARISKAYSRMMKNNRTIDESFRSEMVGLLQDCDNFLKDTTEAFVYTEFADTLWVPSAYMTFIRVMFLTEAANYGIPLKIDEETIFMFWSELKADIRRHLRFTVDYGNARVKTLHSGDNLTAYEYEGCKIQKLLLYLDRQIYPFGVPNRTVISDDESEVKIADFNVTAEDDEIRHIQILFNDYKKQLPTLFSRTVLNCIMGPSIITRISTVEMTFRVIYVPQKSYQVRVLYFIQESVNSRFYIRSVGSRKNRSISAHKETEAEPFQVMRMTEEDPNRSPQRFEFKTALHEMKCSSGIEKCVSSGSFYRGRFVVETVLMFNVLSEADSNATIILEDIRPRGPDTFFFGVELIVRPYQEFLSTW